MSFVNLIVLIIQFILLIRACRIFYKNPLDFGAIFLLFYLIFYAPGYWNYLYDLGLYTNSFFQYFGVSTDISIITRFNLISTLIMVSFEFGYSLSRRKRSKDKEFDYKYIHKNYRIAMLTLLSVWFLIIVDAFINYGGSLFLFFSPARKNAYTSGYATSLVVIIPTILLTLKVLKNIAQNKKTNKTIWVYVILLLLSSISLGQRREMIYASVYIAILLVLANFNKVKQGVDFFKTFKFRVKVIRLGIVTSVLVPTLWWARTYFTQVQRGDANIILPWKLRGWFELLFGSSSTGFQSTIVLDSFDKLYGIPYLHSLMLMLTIPIPRSILPSKPVTIPKLMQFTLNDTGNISLFYINDIYFNFGLFCLIASFIFGYTISYFYNRSLKSKNLVNKIPAIVLISQIILLFKNGFAQYCILLFLYLFLYFLMRRFVFPRKIKVTNKDEIVLKAQEE